LEPLAALEPFPRRDRDDANRAGARDVRPAARRQIELFDVDQPKRALARRRLAQLQTFGFLRIRKPDRHRPVFPHDPVRFGFGRGDVGGLQLASQVDGRDIGAEMKAHRPRAEQPVERGRQYVLPGMLLHVIEAARPVDHAVNALADLQGLRVGPTKAGPYAVVDDMEDLSLLVVDDVNHAYAAERADVERLPAGGGIEARAIEHDDRAAVAALDASDYGIKLTAVWIGVIEAVGHGLPGLTSRLAEARRRTPPAARRKMSRRPRRCPSSRWRRHTSR